MPPKRAAKPAAGRRVVPDDGPTPAEEGHKGETPQPPPTQLTQPTQPTQPVLASETVEAAVPAQPIVEHVPPKKKVGRPRKNVAPAPPPGEAGASEPPPATFVATGDQEASPSSEAPKPKKRGRKKAGGEEAGTITTGKPVNEAEDVPAASEAKTTGEKTKRKPGRPRKEQQRQEGGTQGEAATQVEEDKPKRRPGRPRKDPTAEPGAEVAKTASQPSGAEITPAEKPRKKIGRPRKNEPPASEPPNAQQQEQEQHDASHNVQHDDESDRVSRNLSDPQAKLEEEPQPSVASTATPTTTTTTTIAPAEAPATSESQKSRRKVGRPRKSEVVQESTIAATSGPQAADAIVDSGGTHQRGRKRAHSQSEGDSQAPTDAGTNVDAPPAKTRRRPGRPKKSEMQSSDEPAAEGSSMQPQQETSADVGTSEKPKRERKPFDLHTMPLPKPQSDNAKGTPQEQSSANDEQQVSEQAGKPRRGRKKRPTQPATVNEQDVEVTETSSKDMDTDAPRVSKKRGRPRKQPEAPPSTTAQKRRAVDDESQATEQTNKPETGEQEVVSPPQKKNKSEHISDSEEGVDLSSPPPKDAQDMVDPRQEKLQEQLQAMQARRLAAANANREEVFAEHQRAKSSPRMQVQHERKRAEAEKILEREQIEKAGGDYERHRAWTYTAEEAEQWDEQQEIKAKRAETGFSDYNQMAQKKYDRQIREFKPDLQAYEEQKHTAMEDPSTAGGEENFYRDANSLSFASVDNKPSREAVDRLVSDVQKQEERREKFSRQKPVNEEDDITFINERNRRFNDKIGRFYGKHTKEIRENFERGTAL